MRSKNKKNKINYSFDEEQNNNQKENKDNLKRIVKILAFILIFIILLVVAFNSGTKEKKYVVKEKKFDESIYSQYEIGDLKFIVPKEWTLDETKDEETSEDDNSLIFRFPDENDGYFLVDYDANDPSYLYNNHEIVKETHNRVFATSDIVSDFEEIDCSEIDSEFDIKGDKYTMNINDYSTYFINYHLFDDYSGYLYGFTFNYSSDKLDYLNKYLPDIMNSIYCFDTVPHDAPKVIEEETSEEVVESEDNTEKEEYKEEKEEDNKVFINLEEIYNDNGIQINTTNIGYNKNNRQVCISYDLTNNSSKDIRLSIDYIDVNGYTVPAYKGKNKFGSVSLDNPLDEVIYDGSTLSSTICFNIDDLKYSKMKTYQYFKFYIDLYDLDYNTIDRKYIEIYTNKNGSYEEDYSFDGQTVYESSKYKCYIKPYDKYNIEHPLLIYVENNSTNTLSLSYDGIKVNGVSYMDMLSSGINVLPNSHYIGLVNFEYLYMLSDSGKPSSIDNISMYISFIPTRSNGHMISTDFFNSKGFTIDFN